MQQRLRFRSRLLSATPTAALRSTWHLQAALCRFSDGGRLREYRIVREVETLAEWDGAARRLIARPATPGQGLAVLVQSGDIRVIGAAN